MGSDFFFVVIFISLSFLPLLLGWIGYKMIVKAESWTKFDIRLFKLLGFKMPAQRTSKALKAGAIGHRMNGSIVVLGAFVAEGILFYYLIYKTLLA